MTFFNWSRTAATNATADSTINFAEGQAPSSLNDSCRAMMAAAAKYRDDLVGFNSSGGTSTAYTLSSYQVFDSLAHMDARSICFIPHVTNGAAATLNVDGLGAKGIYMTYGGDAIVAGTMIAGTPYTLSYFAPQWVLHGLYGNPYNIPLGGLLPYIGSTAPNSSFVLPYGQAISRSTYATLFALVGTGYGVGDGSSTFNIPDLRGRIAAGKDDMGGSAASRLTSTYFGTSAATLGAVGGSQNNTIATHNLPPYTPAGSVSNGAITINGQTNLLNSTGVASGTGASGFNGQLTAALTASQASSTFTGTAQGGVSDPLGVIQPTIITNYILRVL